MYKVIVCSYKEPRKMVEKCLKHIRNANGVPILVKDISPIGRARNTGLKLVNDDYVFFVDADQFVPPTFFSSIISFLKQSDPKLGGVWAIPAPPKNASLLQRLDQMRTSYFLREKIGKDVAVIGAGASCYKKQAIRGLKFNENIITCEDVEFSKRVRKRGWKLALVPIEVEHARPKDYHDFVNVEFYLGVGYVQVGGPFIGSIKNLSESGLQGLRLSTHFREPLFFPYCLLQALIWFAGTLKAFCSNSRSLLSNQNPTRT